VQLTSKKSLFSALISKTTTHHNELLDINLDIPDLPDDLALVKWQVPSSPTYEWINYRKELKLDRTNDCRLPELTLASSSLAAPAHDEGFFSNRCSPLSQQKNDVLWEFAANHSISNYVDWDMKTRLDH
jgi:hypothetical protein